MITLASPMTSLVTPPAAPLATRPPIIRIHELSKRFFVRRRWLEVWRPRVIVTALDRVSLTVGEGEIVGLLGPNGAGKTTLLKTLSTLVIPDEGTVEVDGHDVERHPAAVRRVLVPVTADERSLDWRLSARENLRLYAVLYGLRGAVLRRRVNEALDRVGLGDVGEKLAGDFSSGMKQRLLIARGLLATPRVLLLDEPTRSLDPLAARAFRDFLRHEVAGRAGCTIVLATHDPSEAMELCDRMAILDRGRLLAIGTPRELATEFWDERYRIWTRSPDHPAFRALAAHATLVGRSVDDEGHPVIDVTLSSGGDAASEMLASLVRAGVAIGRFEKVRPTLVDLMERVVRRRNGSRDA